MIAFILICFPSYCQQFPNDSINDIHQSKYKKRQNILKWGGIGVYTVGSIGLYNSWYKNYDQEDFHFFNDLNEWENVDKLGHIHASYFQADLIYKSLKWSGVKESKAILIGSLTSLGFQSTIEIMDGFSSGWGFSIPDYTANLIGITSFALQQKLWGEQKFKIKVSYWPKTYANEPINSQTDFTFRDRANDLFGRPFYQKLVKDYNAQTVWISSNPRNFNPDLRWPEWLNFALGYGADNMYGGFNNTWQHSGGSEFSISNTDYPRTKQFVLALDYDLSKVKTDSAFLKSALDVLNIFKWPAPAIELTSKGEFKFHLLFLN
ncbi:MAG: DUF2279 domain-containing protein [Saprospiraceae bacterium]|nr:YfiM family protein [Bacteroidia bacterium]NNL90807.1 DUF2279 domain-containing protein [Saprospiraceae bacterium]